MGQRYDSPAFNLYYEIEAERRRFEYIIDGPRDFSGDEDAEEKFYEEATKQYLSNLRALLLSD